MAKTFPVCMMKECGDTAAYHPIVLFTNGNGATVRCIVGLKVCRKHKKLMKEPTEVLADGGDKLAEALGKSSPIVSRQLVWCALDSVEARAFARAQEKKSASA
jgi:hypothetical protein